MPVIQEPTTTIALTIEEAAERLRLHPATVKKYLQSGLIPGCRIGGPKYGSWRVAPSTIDAMLAGKLPLPTTK